MRTSQIKTTLILLTLTVLTVPVCSNAQSSQNPEINVVVPANTNSAKKKKAKAKSKQTNPSGLASALGSLFQGGGSTPQGATQASATNRTADGQPTVYGNAACDSSMNPSLKSSFDRCMARYATTSVVQSKNKLVLDMDRRVGYLLDGNGRIKSCFTITIGSAGIGTGVNQSEPGLFFTNKQGNETSKYRDYDPDPEKKGLSMGIGGKILHSDHGNRTTAGCIGIQQSKWMEVFNALGTDQSPVYAWGKDHAGCGTGNNTPVGGEDNSDPSSKSAR